MRTVLSLTWALGAAASLLLSGPSRCSADFVTFATPAGASVAGGPVSSTATLTTLGGGQLQILLTNGLATAVPAQVLNSILFAFDGATPTLSLISVAATAGSTVFTAPNASNPSFDLTPGYRVTNTSGAVGGFAYEGGVGSSGEGGVFSGGLGNEDYGIVGPGTNLNQNNFGNKFPLVESLSASPSSVTIVLGGFGGRNASEISGLAFVYGSAPDGVIAGTRAAGVVPEPAAALSTLTGLSLVGGAAWGRRRRRAA